MTSDPKACPNCETPMTVMASMPSIQRQGSWSFFLCPQCGKVERERVERQSDVKDGDAEPGHRLESETK
jgi:RNase P subunit RPR2